MMSEDNTTTSISTITTSTTTTATTTTASSAGILASWGEDPPDAEDIYQVIDKQNCHCSCREFYNANGMIFQYFYEKNLRFLT